MTQHHISVISTMMVLGSISVYMALHFSGVIRFEDVVLEAKFSLLLAVLLLVNVIIIMVFYSAHFAQTISDPVYVVKRGLKEKSYAYTAKINPHYKNDEVFELAEIYNTQWLPFKLRIYSGKSGPKQDSNTVKDDYSDLL